MHVHLPKPLHGWRAFFGEVGIIVLGVLIALAAEQVVEDWRWHERAKDAQRAINHELAQNAAILDERTIMAPCLSQQLKQVARLIETSKRSGRIGDVKGLVGPATRPLVTTAWDAAGADDTATHLSAENRQTYAVIYTVIVDLRRQLDEENRLWTHLLLLEDRPGAISDSMITEIANYSTELGYRDWQVSTGAAQQLEQIRAAGIKPDYSLVMEEPGGHAELLRQARLAKTSSPDCMPITVDGKPVPLKAPIL